ncbi:phosphatidylserine decarboxylase [Sulfurimonas sp.]
MKNNLFPIAKEGWNYIAYSFVAFVVFSILDLDFFEFISFLLMLSLIFVFRNPERELPRFGDNSVVSPVDGSVLSIEEAQTSDYAYKVTIESSYTDVAILRAPMNAKMNSISKQSGTRLSSNSLLSNKLNENATIIFEDENSNKVKIYHMLKQSFSEIKIDAIKSQKLFQSSRYGVMVDGITTIYLPQNFRLNITVGNELNASESLIGYFS